MKTLVFIIFILFSAIGLSQTASSRIHKDSINLQFLSTLILEKINLERSKFNLNPLTSDPTLKNFAKKHSNWMASTGRLEHHTAYTSIKYAECIAPAHLTFLGEYSITYDNLASIIVNKWMASTKGHREELLCPNRTKEGVYPALKFNNDGFTFSYTVYATHVAF